MIDCPNPDSYPGGTNNLPRTFPTAVCSADSQGIRALGARVDLAEWGLQTTVFVTNEQFTQQVELLRRTDL